MPTFRKLSIVIPVYNEQATIRQIIERADNAPIDLKKEIIVVDDASSDGTKKTLEEVNDNSKNIKVLFHDRNMGKGAALRTAFQSVTGDIVIIQDADLEYDPKEYPKVLEPILDGRADVVFGSRFLGGPRNVLLFWHYVGNKFLTLLSNCFTNINLTDMETCYKAFTADVLKKITIKCNRFGFEPEFTAKVAKNKFRIYEVPISYSGRSYDEGKKITWKDGLRAIFTILWFRFFD